MSPDPARRRTLSRRQFLAAVGAGTAACGLGFLDRDRILGASHAVRLAHAGIPAAPADLPVVASPLRALVVLELAGGNDGLSMLVPYSDPAYLAHRRRTSIDPAAVLRIDDQVGLHPALVQLHRMGAAWVEGVGVSHPDLSHFEMMRRWWLGDPDGLGSGPASDGTGFLGRLCDAVGDPSAPLVGVSLSTTPTPALAALRASTSTLGGGDGTFPAPGDDQLAAAWRAAWTAMAQPDRADATALVAARSG